MRHERGAALSTYCVMRLHSKCGGCDCYCHVSPTEAGLVPHERKGGPTWGLPSDDGRWAS